MTRFRSLSQPLISFTLLALVVLIASSVLVSCGSKEIPKPPPAPVKTAVAALKDVPVDVRNIGTVEPIQTVTLRSQVAGYITRVLFKEGDAVVAGQPLFQIDARPFDANLQQAQANFEQNRAASDNAQRLLARNEELFKDNLVSQEQYEQVKTTAESMKAAVQSNQAAADRARLDRSYTTIKAPLSGVTGNVQANAGNLVKVNDTPLVTLNQITPIRVRFSVPEKFLPEIRRAREAGEMAVFAAPSERDEPPSEGKLVFVDNAVDTATDTILLKGEFENTDRRLWPGQYVDARLILGVRKGAVTVPTRAVLNGQQGTYVYVIDKDGAAQPRNVRLGDATDDTVVILDGLAAGETVITEGQLRVIPGAKVRIADAGEAAAPAGEKSPAKSETQGGAPSGAANKGSGAPPDKK